MKKTAKIILWLLVITILIFGAFITNTWLQFKKMEQATLVMEVATDTIPFSYSSSGHILLKTKINNSKKDYFFMLDSGASNFIFSNYKEEKLENNGYAIGVNAVGDFFTTRIKKINSLAISNVRFEKLNADQIDFDFDCSEEVYGIIGIGLMRHLIWNIDFENQIIIVSKSLNGFKIQKNAIELPLSENPFSHHISTSINFREKGKTIKVLIDSGNSGVLSLKEKEVLKDSLVFKTKKVFGKGSSSLSDNDTRINEDKYYLIDSLFFRDSNYFITNLPVNTRPKGINLLGIGFFKKYKTTISWVDKLLILEPYESIPSFNSKTFGFKTKYLKNVDKVIVQAITENSPAFKVNLPLTSEVLSINNKEISDVVSYCNYKNQLKRNDTVRLKVRINDSIKYYRFRKEYLFD